MCGIAIVINGSLREGFKKKNVKKCGLLPNPPRTPPSPGLVIFPTKKIDPQFFF